MESIKNSIFVSIASYRDDVCPDTLSSLYEMANKPENIFVGICQQNKKDSDDKDCLSDSFKYKDIKLKILKIFNIK